MKRPRRSFVRRGHARPRSRRSIQELFILAAGLLAAIASGIVAYRNSGPYGERGRENPGVRRIVDPATERLRLLIYDSDVNGRFDTWSYMDGDRLLRMEIDSNGDGVIDQRKSFDANISVSGIATSTTPNVQPAEP